MDRPRLYHTYPNWETSLKNIKKNIKSELKSLSTPKERRVFLKSVEIYTRELWLEESNGKEQ